MAQVKAHNQSRGAALVEMAIVLPLLLALTFGLIEYAWLVLKVQQVNGAARYGVRLAVLPDANTDSTRSAILAELARAGINGGCEVTFDPAEVADAEVGTLVTVTIAVQYKGNIDLLRMPLVPVPGTFRVSAAMSKEGP
jgi:Flp pilus assembly protein TadG